MPPGFSLAAFFIEVKMEVLQATQGMILDEDMALFAESPGLFKGLVITGDRIDICKATKSGKMIIEGECTNHSRDMDGEMIITKGLSTGYAEREGKLIWGHTPPAQINAGILPPEFFIGKPLELKPFSKALYLKGLLFKGNPHAEQVFSTMKNNPGDHGIGFSIEGGAISRSKEDRSIITKAWIKNIAMYGNVKNLNTWADVVESIEKAYGPDAFEKAQTLAAIAPLRTEELSGKLTKQTFGGASDRLKRLSNYFSRNPKTGKINWKGGSFSKAYSYLVDEAGMSESDALDLIRLVKARMAQNGK